jgi:DNA primase
MLAGGKSSGEARQSRAPSASRKRALTSVAGGPSVVRRAITLVLNHPESGQKLDINQLEGVNRPGADLLAALIETVQAEPNITTAGLLERWRHDDKGRHLGKLAAMEVPSDEDFDAAAELGECLAQLAIAGRKERVSFLIEKQRVDGLKDDEKSELRQLTQL